MSTPFRLHLPRKIYEEMLAQARSELPNECCGLLAGRVVSSAPEMPTGQVMRRYPLVNAAGSPVEYLSESKSMFAADRDMRKEQLEVLAVYHSHPTSDPVPSRTDRERNYSPRVVNLIISLKGPEPRVQGWWLAAEEYWDAEWEVVED